MTDYTSFPGGVIPLPEKNIDSWFLRQGCICSQHMINSNMNIGGKMFVVTFCSMCGKLIQRVEMRMPTFN